MALLSSYYELYIILYPYNIYAVGWRENKTCTKLIYLICYTADSCTAGYQLKGKVLSLDLPGHLNYSWMWTYTCIRTLKRPAILIYKSAFINASLEIFINTSFEINRAPSKTCFQSQKDIFSAQKINLLNKTIFFDSLKSTALLISSKQH